MKHVLLFPKGSLEKEDRLLLKSAGYVAIEVEEPSKVVLLLPNLTQIKGDAITTSALRALTGSNSSQERQKFGELILSAVLDSK